MSGNRWALSAVVLAAIGCASSGLQGQGDGHTFATPRQNVSSTPAGPTAAAPETSAQPAAAGAALPEPTGRDPLSESVPIGDDLVRGRGTVRCAVPLARVREMVLKYDDYAQFMPFYKSSHVLDRDAESPKVYMQVAALNGLVKMGAQLKMPNAPKKENGWDVYESQFESGNVQDFKAIWRMKAIDDQGSFLSLEVALLPKLPLPTSTLNNENVKGAVNGVTAMRARAEQK